MSSECSILYFIIFDILFSIKCFRGVGLTFKQISPKNQMSERTEYLYIFLFAMLNAQKLLLLQIPKLSL